MSVSIDNAAFECGGAQIRAQSRHLATVVTISGAIHALNTDRVSDYTRRFILEDMPFVLNLSGVTSFHESGVALLRRVDEDCRAAGVEWTLIASDALNHVLDGVDATFPTAASLSEALHDFADAIVARRRLLLPLLTKKSA